MSANCTKYQQNCLSCELKSPLFTFLSREELEMVNAGKLNVVYKKGETIRKQGTYMSHVISVNCGLAKLYLEGEGHRNSIVRIVKPANFIGGPGIYLDHMHHYTVTALTDTTVCLINVVLFKELIDNNNTFAHEFLTEMSSTILSVYNRLVLLTQKKISGRMADTLLYLSDEIYRSHCLGNDLSKQDLADLSGMARNSALKLLRQFHNQGIIQCSDKELLILDYERLQKISLTG